MTSVPARHGDSAGCHPNLEGDGEPTITLFTRCGRDSLPVSLSAREAMRLGASLLDDAKAIAPFVKMWRAANEALTEEDLLNPGEDE